MFVAKLTGGAIQFGGLECATGGDSPFAAGTGTENSLIRGFRGTDGELHLVGPSCQFTQLTEDAGTSIDPAIACERRTSDKRSVVVWADDRLGDRDIHSMVYGSGGKLTSDVGIGWHPETRDTRRSSSTGTEQHGSPGRTAGTATGKST